MKLEKIDYQISCDMPDCNGLSTYRLAFEDCSVKYHICKNCLDKLKKQLKIIGG